MMRNPFFLDGHSGFDWTVRPTGTGQSFSHFFLSMGWDGLIAEADQRTAWELLMDWERGFHDNSTLTPIWYSGPRGKFYGSEFESTAADGDRRLQMQVNTSRDPLAGEYSIYFDDGGTN